MTVDLFDVNAMVGVLPNEPGGGDAAALEAALARVGVREALVGHARAWRHDPEGGNQALLGEIEGRTHLRPVWVAVPDTCGELGGAGRFVDRAVRCGVAAVRLFPNDQGFRLAGADIEPVLVASAEAGLPVIVDADQTTWGEVETVAARHPQLEVIVCSVLYRTLREIAGVLRRTANVSVDLSYLGTHMALEWLVATFGAERVIFGTGVPRRDPADAVTRLLWSELDDATVRQIGSANLRRLLDTRAGLPS